MSGSIKDILLSIGYTNIKDFGDSYRCRPIYRESGNNTSLKIDKRTGRWFDFSASKSGSFDELVKLSLGLRTIEDAKTYLQSSHKFVVSRQKEIPKIKLVKTYPLSILNNLLPVHEYWVDRGISIRTLKLFRGGLATKGKMKGRYVFPIFNSRGEIIGFTGRDTTGASAMKWKHLGTKSEWVWPAFLNLDTISSGREVILVESPSCVLTLWEHGIQNVICLFGVDMSLAVLNFLLKMNPRRMYISTNNEPGNNSIGNQAAEKIEKKLCKYFDAEQVSVALPFKKDFGEQSKEENIQWYDSIKHNT